MPSAALSKFENNLLVDVDRLIQSHGQLNHQGMGRRGLGHITRSGVLMLCAAWELHLEELLIESARIIVDRAASPADLPKKVQKEIAKAVRESKHELKPLDLAGEGWRDVYINHATVRVQGLNTPTSANVDTLFHLLVGFPGLSQNWSHGAGTIDNFVSVRGDIAHRGRAAQYVTIGNLVAYKNQIVRTVIDTDNALVDFLRANTQGRAPWRRRVT
jgi:hypothetical protein